MLDKAIKRNLEACLALLTSLSREVPGIESQEDMRTALEDAAALEQEARDLSGLLRAVLRESEDDEVETEEAQGDD